MKKQILTSLLSVLLLVTACAAPFFSNTLRVVWSPSPEAALVSGYTVYEQQPGSTNWTALATVNGTNAVVPASPRGTLYTVTAIGIDGQESIAPAPVTNSFLTPPGQLKLGR